MNDLVSVVIPTYNRGYCIDKAIHSVLMQKYIYIEVLVCDDGSTDNTQKKVSEIAFHDRRVKWLPGEHTGLPSVARNKGIRKARGEWLAFLDSDDVWMPDKISTQLEISKSRNQSALCSNALRVKDGNQQGNYLNSKVPEMLDFKNILNSNQIICSSVLVKRELVIMSGLFPTESKLKALEDYALWLRLATSVPFFYVDRPLLYYTDDPAQSIRKHSKSTRLQKRVVINNYLKWLMTQEVAGKLTKIAYAVKYLI